MQTHQHKTTRHWALAGLLTLLSVVPARAFDASTYADTSRLATGVWLKIKVTDNGIHTITADDARRWGLGDLSRVHVFGYGGAMLGEALTGDTPDDLPQVPVVRRGDAILFYAQGPTVWQNASEPLTFVQSHNPYSTAGYYFVTNDSRYSDIKPAASDAAPAGETVTTFVDRLYHEVDLYNIGQTGRVFFGEDFSSTASRSFNFTLKGRAAGTPVNVRTQFGAKTVNSGSQLTFAVNGTPLPTVNSDYIRPTADPSHEHYYPLTSDKTIDLDGTNELTYTVNFASTGTVNHARLDYVTVNYERPLSLDGGYLQFGTADGPAQATYRLAGCGEHTAVWDVTVPHRPVALRLDGEGTTRTFAPAGAGKREYVAFDSLGTTFPVPEPVGIVAPQNLHGQPTPDLIIIAPSDYLTQAQRLAAMHAKADTLRVMVVNKDLVYNEFSSGTPDVMAYRRLCKMFWDRGADSTGHRLRYLLLFGGGSHDNRLVSDRVKSAAYPMLLLWESAASDNENTSYCTDDCLAILEDNATANFERHDLSIAVGRLPVRSVTEATAMVDKIIKYASRSDYGMWKNNALFTADDEDNGIHMIQAERVINTARANGGNNMVFNHVFIDAFDAVSTGSGRTYPAARDLMFSRLTEGVLWWNYTGHGNPSFLTGENLLNSNDVDQRLFYHHLPVFYGATCDFTRFDASEVSSGERLLLNANGGAVAVICPPRLVYIPNNGALNNAVGQFIFSRDEDGLPRRLGDIMRLGKNACSKSTNNLRYFLHGDPALRLALPTHRVVIETINGQAVDPDNMPVFKARQQITFTGSIVDTDGNAVTDFNGNVLSTLYDSEQSVVTHGYGDGAEFVYQDRTNRLQVSNDSVSNGRFTIKMTIPSEIVANYDNYSPSLINLYAYNPTDSIEAQGSNSDFYIYGYDDTVVPDTTGPDITRFVLNNNDFTDGAQVNESPLVIAEVYDPSGINISNGGIGHSMTLTLDEKTTYSDVVSFFTPVHRDDAEGGIINYALSNLETGRHTLRLKVWDVFNNPSEKTISFNVVKGLKPELVDVYAVANPASVDTKFYVRHNRPDAVVTVRIEVYDLMGRLLWSTSQSGRSDMDVAAPVTWNLIDNSGRRVPRGIYVYRASVSSDGVRENSKARRLAVTD